MSKGTGATPAMTWKSGVLAVILLLGIIGPLLIVSWMWGGPGFCPAVPMMSQMENINDKMSKPNPDGGADLMWGTGICTIYLRPFDPDDENHLVESDSNSFGVKIVMHEYIHCLQQGLTRPFVSTPSTSPWRTSAESMTCTRPKPSRRSPIYPPSSGS